MSILSIIDFGKNLVSEIEKGIKKVEKIKKLTNEQKKAKVDEIAYAYFDANFNKLKINFLVKAYLRKKIRKAIPVITQKVFDLIATTIEGITNKIQTNT